ncbi:3-oxoacyl-[acyl-carrier-protein] reductase [Peptoniphilus mikwangii]|uniref:3-oxoacyl-[acyl-carrier-protein] reductase n=1 Tax=Peptoniphilus mikwangii TaxID=1354300 RepID=UPI00040B7DA2|nr:3-oxoacyl-[acyl-carrier-protein] reductase [Peptoniphilus mikwangii]
MKNRTALITGATRGIGKRIAIEFADRGYNLIINYRDKESFELLEKEISDNCQLLGVRGDVSNFEDVSKIFDEGIKRFGTIDVLVNNAGITSDNLAIRMSNEEFDKVIDVNLKGCFYFMKLAAKHMLKNRNGRIISISSVVGLHGNAGQINYAASKAGLIGMTKTLALELASRNITVNAVAPGFIETEMTDKLSDNSRKLILDKVPLNRIGTTEDVAKAVIFLASDDARYITGQVLSVDGGMNI